MGTENTIIDIFISTPNLGLSLMKEHGISKNKMKRLVIKELKKRITINGHGDTVEQRFINSFNSKKARLTNDEVKLRFPNGENPSKMSLEQDHYTGMFILNGLRAYKLDRGFNNRIADAMPAFGFRIENHYKSMVYKNDLYNRNTRKPNKKHKRNKRFYDNRRR